MWNNVPLNAVQLAEVLMNPAQYDEGFKLFLTRDDTLNMEYEEFEKQYADWILEYLFYIDTGYYTQDESGRQYHTVMLVPLKAKEPGVFQIYYTIHCEHYTSLVHEFYPAVT